MADLLARATSLIAVLGSRPQALSEVAGAAGLAPATATRLLKRLVELGWADQDGNRGAYRLGPRAYALADAVPYRRELIDACTGPMRALAARHPAAGVVLVVLRPWGRHLLWECGAFAGGRQGRLRLLAEDLWSGASGRLLVACLPARERQAWIDHVGLPAPAAWRGIVTRRELLAALAELRRAGESEVEQPRRGLWACAVPIPDREGGTAALGAYQPINLPRAPLFAGLRRAAAQAGGTA